MIRKANSAFSKAAYTPIQVLQPSQFTVQNQEQCSPLPFYDNLDELDFNIIKIRQCKQQTQQLISDMQFQMTHQQQKTLTYKQLYQQEKKKNKLLKSKYHQGLICLRRKEEQTQAQQRNFQNLLEKYNFIKNNAQKTQQELLLREQNYKQKIHMLENQLEQQQSLRSNSYFTQTYESSRGTGLLISGLGKQDESTFI